MNEKTMEKVANEYARYHYADSISQEICAEDFKAGYVKGYEAAEKDILAIIQSRISEILGDAQPKPVLRAELQELIKRIKEERND